MRYRKIPFYQTRNATMDGLAPVVKKIPPHAFGPMFPNSDFLGAVADTTVIMRPQPDAPAGFPGFFAWLKATQPAMYNYAKTALPAYVTQAEGHRTGGATLSGLGIVTRPPTKPVLKITPYFNAPEFGLGGLGDDGSDTFDVSVDTSALANSISVPLPTVNIPDPNSETSSIGVPPSQPSNVVSQIVSTLTQAAPSILNDINSQTVFNAQLARAQAGLPPLNTASYGIGTTIAGSALPILLIGGGLLAFMLLSKK